jgi:hypothetical protein
VRSPIKLLITLTFSLFLTSLLALAKPPQNQKRRPAGSCPTLAPVRSIEEDYAQTFGTEPGDDLTIRRIDLNGDGTPEWIVAATLSCGAHGCEYAIYQQATDQCFQKIGVLSGSLRVLNSPVTGYKDLGIQTRPGADAHPTKRIWKFQPSLGVYLETDLPGEK